MITNIMPPTFYSKGGPVRMYGGIVSPTNRPGPFAGLGKVWRPFGFGFGPGYGQGFWQGGLGDAASDAAVSAPRDWSSVAWRAAYAAAVGGAVYHGYKRNNSVGWAIGWGVFAAFIPIIAVPVALAQGFGKRAGR